MADLNIHFPAEHYVGMVSNRHSGEEGKDQLPLAFMTPEGSDKAAEKRRDSVNSWVQNNSRQYNHQTRQNETLRRLPAVVLKNEPLAGFRMLEEVRRDSSWGSGNVKWRVEDPRGFELEISSPNLMKILACTAVDQGEILDQCMWARQGSENILVPVSSSVYRAAVENTERQAKKASMRDLRIGDIAVMQNGQRGTYMGKLRVWIKPWGGSNSILKAEHRIRHLFLDMTVPEDELSPLEVASPKLAEIIPGDGSLTAEQAVDHLHGLKDKGYWGVLGYSIGNTEPVCTREKQPFDWNSISTYGESTVVFQDGDDYYTAHLQLRDLNSGKTTITRIAKLPFDDHLIIENNNHAQFWTRRDEKDIAYLKGLPAWTVRTVVTTPWGKQEIINH